MTTGRSTRGGAGDEEARRSFAEDVGESLARTPPQIAAKYFYDELGSQLFEAICRLPWYRVARAERALLRRHGAAVLGQLRSPAELIELGCGSGDKLATLIESADRRIGAVQLVDISRAALDMTARRLGQIGVDVAHAHLAGYEAGLANAVCRREGHAPLIVLFLGSNIGNFDPPVRQGLLETIRRALRPGDALLLGADLVKPEADLLLAYDDPLGVTAAFNLNVLRRINDELGATFALEGFTHRAVWNAPEQRVEMHLVSRRHQRVAIPAVGFETTLEEGAFIWTESSYKYEPAQIRQFGVEAGLGPSVQWVDQAEGFALTLFQVAD